MSRLMNWRYQLVCLSCRVTYADLRDRETAADALAVRSTCIDCNASLVIIRIARKDPA